MCTCTRAHTQIHIYNEYSIDAHVRMQEAIRCNELMLLHSMYCRRSKHRNLTYISHPNGRLLQFINKTKKAACINEVSTLIQAVLLVLDGGCSS